MKPRSSSSSGYTGVSFDKYGKKWVAHITINGKKKHIGQFKEKKDAIDARESYLKEIWDTSAVN